MSETNRSIAGGRDVSPGPVHMRLSGISLQLPTYLQHERAGRTWIKTLLAAATDRPERRLRTILNNIDLAFEDGDRVALIGRNGAGKTSLLNVLTGCYLPTTGRVDVAGTRQALLNVSLGFNFEATVRENVMLRGTAMGIRMGDLQELVEPILEFAELKDVTHHRLGTLSAGQRMRLGFAISTSVQPDIMLLDEWIGTGDAEFMAKARHRMQDRVSGSRLLVLASHSPDLLKRVCNRGVVLENGSIGYDGPIVDALRYYGDTLRAVASEQPVSKEPHEFRRRSIPHGKRYGLVFANPVHCLFDNRSVHADSGSSDYVCLLETDAPSVSVALAELSASMHQQGFALVSCEGSGLPNIFKYKRSDGAAASVTLIPYGVKDTRQSSNASGRLHVTLSGWPA